MKNKNILVVCTSPRDERELKMNSICHHYKIHFQEYDSHKFDKILCSDQDKASEPYSPADEIEKILTYCKNNSIDAVVSTDDYPGCILSSIVAQKLNLPGPTPQSVLTCQHKYYSRVAQQKFVPAATPEFKLIDPKKIDPSFIDLSYPLFIKPVKSYFSMFANKIVNYDELLKTAQTSLPAGSFLAPLNWFLKNYSSYELNAEYLLVERLLQGEQVTLEGYVYNGQVEILGVVDSIMFPDTLCFERFDYPSHLSKAIQNKMATIATEYIEGIKLDNSLFNVELMYNPINDEIHIIEVNSRMSTQFADLFEKVDGTNTYQILLDLALGNKPKFSRKKGKYNTAASFVLRRFDNKQVINRPTEKEITKVFQEVPDIRIEIYAIKGQDLSQFLQDGKSFRYGLINLSAQTTVELFHKFEICKKKLPIIFK